jgi:hypothetical protein
MPGTIIPSQLPDQIASATPGRVEVELQPLSSVVKVHLSDAEEDDDLLEDGEKILYPRVVTRSSSPSSWTWWMSDAWNDYFFPPDVPEPCQLLRRENIAVPACYLLVGLLQGLSSVAVNVMPLDLGATEAQQTTVSSIRGLPSSFKLLFGFWSDNVSTPSEVVIHARLCAFLEFFAHVLCTNCKLSFQLEAIGGNHTCSRDG